MSFASDGLPISGPAGEFKTLHDGVFGTVSGFVTLGPVAVGVVGCGIRDNKDFAVAV